jgi:hypothetical protein
VIGVNGFQAFADYMGLKLHFNSSDYIWHPDRKTRIKLSTFGKRKDRVFFMKLERDYRYRHLWIEAIISGIIHNNDMWIGDLFEDTAVDFHKARMSRVAGLESIFSQDCDKIHFYMFDNNITFENLILTSPQKDPIIISLYTKKMICLETLVLLHHLNSWTAHWSPINPLQIQRRVLIRQYHHLLHLADRNLKKLQTTYNYLAHT